MNASDSFNMKPMDREQIVNPLVRLAADYWTGLCSRGDTPPWSSFDSLAQPDLIPYLVQINVTLEGGIYNFSYQLIGNRIAELYGDVTGATLNTDAYQSIINEQTGNRSNQMYTMAAEQSKPVMGSGPIEVLDPLISKIELVALPFVDEAGKVSNLITVGVAE